MKTQLRNPREDPSELREIGSLESTLSEKDGCEDGEATFDPILVSLLGPVCLERMGNKQS